MFFQWPLQWLPNKTNDKIKIHLIDWEAWISHCQVYNFPITPSILSFKKKAAFFHSVMMTMGSFLGTYNFYFYISLCRPLRNYRAKWNPWRTEDCIEPMWQFWHLYQSTGPPGCLTTTSPRPAYSSPTNVHTFSSLLSPQSKLSVNCRLTTSSDF